MIRSRLQSWLPRASIKQWCITFSCSQGTYCFKYLIRDWSSSSREVWLWSNLLSRYKPTTLRLCCFQKPSSFSSLRHHEVKERVCRDSVEQGKACRILRRVGIQPIWGIQVGILSLKVQSNWGSYTNIWQISLRMRWSEENLPRIWRCMGIHSSIVGIISNFGYLNIMFQSS